MVVIVKAFFISLLVWLILIAAGYELFLFVKGIAGADENFSAGDFKLKGKHIGWLVSLYCVILVVVLMVISFKGT